MVAVLAHHEVAARRDQPLEPGPDAEVPISDPDLTGRSAIQEGPGQRPLVGIGIFGCHQVDGQPVSGS